MLWLKNKVRRSEFLRRNKFLWNVLRRMYRFVKYCLARLFGRLKEDERDLLYVDPHAVAHVVSRDDETMSERDSRGQPVHEHGSIYAILKRRIEEKAAYEQIPEFSQNVERIQGGAPIEGCTTEKEYLDRWRELEDLYWRIEQNGYKTQVELQTGDLSDEIKVQIGRQGELLLERGLPRLIIAQLLNLDQIPVIVTRRDQEWDKLRQDIVKIVVQRGFFHQPFNHPDLDMIPQFYGRHRAGTATYGNERWDYIVNSLPVAKGTVLDIGSYFGYFAHRFEELGFECYAVEPDKENLAVLKRYRRMMSKTFTVWEESIFDIERFEFDIILALNIFHHLIKTRHDYEQLVAFLGKIRCKAMYFEPQQVLKDTYKSFTDEEFVNFVLSNSKLNHSHWLGRAKEGRDIYLLTV
jgi:SAM-dependent methyltransferase